MDVVTEMFRWFTGVDWEPVLRPLAVLTTIATLIAAITGYFRNKRKDARDTTLNEFQLMNERIEAIRAERDDYRAKVKERDADLEAERYARLLAEAELRRVKGGAP